MTASRQRDDVSAAAPPGRREPARPPLARLAASTWLVFAGAVLSLAPVRDHAWWAAWAAWSPDLAEWADGSSVRGAMFALGVSCLGFGILDLLLCLGTRPPRT